MAKYTYNAGQVSSAIDKLCSASSALNDTNADIQKGIDTIFNARGAENMNIDFDVIKNYKSQVVECVDQMTTEIRNKAQEIEDYQNAPWYKKLFATIGLGALKLIEGLATFVENIGDGLVSILGFIGGIFSSDFKDCIGEFVKKDWVGDAFYDAYETGWLQDVNKYSVMSHQSTAANVLKGVGVAAGYVILSVATAGAGTAVSLGVSAAAAGVGGIGSGTQAGLQQGKTFNQAFAGGLKDGVVAAGTTLIIGGIANKLTATGRAATAIDDVAKVGQSAGQARTAAQTLKSVLANSGDDLAGLADDAGKLVNSLDEVATLADDAAMLGGTTVQNASQTLKSAKDIVKSAESLKVAAKAAGAGDDVINAIDDVINSADDVVKSASIAKSSVAAAQGTNAVSSDSKLVHAANKVANNSAVQKGAGVISKVTKPVTNLAQKALSTPGGQKLVAGATKLATKAGPVGSNAIATGLAVGKDSLQNPAQSNAYRDFTLAQQEPSIAQNLYENTTNALNEGTPTVATDDQAAQNLQNLKDQGYEPGSNSTDFGTGNDINGPGNTGVTPEIPNNENGPTNTMPENQDPTNTNRPYVPDTEISGPSVDLNEFDPTPSVTPENQDSLDNIISSQDPIGDDYRPGPSNNDSPSIDNMTNNSDSLVDNVSDYLVDNSTVGEDVLNTFGEASGSFAGITGSSSTNIPTSSSPILSSEGKTATKSMIPLGAGLGAAAVAGIAAKAVMDKKEKSEDEEDLNVEEWEEDANSVEVDYSADTEEAADYLSPTDEYAFQE